MTYYIKTLESSESCVYRFVEENAYRITSIVLNALSKLSLARAHYAKS